MSVGNDQRRERDRKICTLRDDTRESKDIITTLSGWKAKSLRGRQEKNKGLRPELRPDPAGAFVHTLLGFYKDPRQSHKSSSRVQDKAYKARKVRPSKKSCVVASQENTTARQMVEPPTLCLML